MSCPPPVIAMALVPGTGILRFQRPKTGSMVMVGLTPHNLQSSLCGTLTISEAMIRFTHNAIDSRYYLFKTCI